MCIRDRYNNIPDRTTTEEENLGLKKSLSGHKGSLSVPRRHLCCSSPGERHSAVRAIRNLYEGTDCQA